jgi:uncharacterized protein (DUF433 family)
MAVDRITETIIRKSGVLEGQPFIVGTEITVVDMLDLLAEGVFPQEIVTEKYFPQVNLDQVYACIAFGSQTLRAIKWE